MGCGVYSQGLYVYLFTCCLLVPFPCPQQVRARKGGLGFYGRIYRNVPAVNVVRVHGIMHRDVGGIVWYVQSGCLSCKGSWKFTAEPKRCCIKACLISETFYSQFLQHSEQPWNSPTPLTTISFSSFQHPGGADRTELQL